MQIIEEISPLKRNLAGYGGVFLTLTAILSIWTGFSSLLIGLAFSQQKGFWVPVLIGAFLLLGGIWLLFWAIGNIRLYLLTREENEVGF